MLQSYEKNAKYIKVTKINVTNNNLSIEIDCSENIKKYFLNRLFFVEYDQDVTNVDKSILSVPIVSNIITMAWAVGADIYVKELDKTYLDSLRKIEFVFKKWYPQFLFSSNFYVENIISNQFNGRGYGLLFSGGLDSLTSFIRHKDKHPDLFTVWGADIPVNENDFWEKVKKENRLFSNQNGVNIHFIKTNITRSLNVGLLAREYNIKDWWGKVNHGLMLLSLVAPLTTKGIGTILIAASHTKDFNEPWGSHPSIDNNIAWADVRVVHDGYELSRHKKIRLIKEHPRYLSTLRVCYSSRSGYNCSRCEKCLRTITSLILEGINPENYKFNTDKNIFRYIKDFLVKGRLLHMGANEIYMWTDIQKHIPEQFNSDIQGSKEFFKWFKEFDLSQYWLNRLQYFLYMIPYIIAKDGMVKTIKKAIPFIVRKLRH